MQGSNVDEIKRRLDIVDVISGYIKLRKAGANFKAVCPFHSEKTPSFMVSPEKQMWYCFGCGEGGDLFSFIQKIENIEFKDALVNLAVRAGVELTPGDHARVKDKNVLLEVCEAATKFFEKQLESGTGKGVVAYLTKRGLTPETIAEWRLGYAPDDWGSLYSYLRSRNFSERDIERAGLSVKSERAGKEPHDRFRHRVMFPIESSQGGVIGFSGRLFEVTPSKTAGKDAGKYINTPNTALYDKSQVLFGLSRAKAAIKEGERAILTEGNLDVVLAHQAGTKETVATCGTSVGDSHLTVLKRLTGTLVLAFDADSAGRKASLKTARDAYANGFDVLALELPAGKDIADIASHDPAEWKKISGAAEPFPAFAMRLAHRDFPGSAPADTREFVRASLAPIAPLPSAVEKERWIHELSRASSVSVEAVREELKEIERKSGGYGADLPAPGSQDATHEPKSAAEQYFVSLSILHPEKLAGLAIEEDFMLYSPFQVVLTRLAAGESAQQVSRDIPEISGLLFASELVRDFVEDEEREFERMFSHVRRLSLQRNMRAPQKEIARAESAGGEDLEELMNSFQALATKLSEFDSTPPHAEKAKTR